MLTANRRISVVQGHLVVPCDVRPAVRCSTAAKEAKEVPPPLPTRESFQYFLPIQTRWKDNDQYGHVNNAVYYDYFDTAINHWLIKKGGLEIGKDVRAVIVSSACHFYSSVKYPSLIEAAIRAKKVQGSLLSFQ